MCILCVIQKWSRRVATMLPWLVVPLICLWAVSQLLPPAFRFEITSPRLACVFVLLVTLFWYEILMPQLSAWRVKRNARARERKRLEAIEMQKMRKTATRRCRNCLTPYKDQNPGGGRFMCSYCGHVSKRPVLDLIGKVSLDSSLICGGQEWLENGNLVSGSRLTQWQKSSGTLIGGDDHYADDKSYFCGVVFICRPLTYFFVSIRRLWGNLSSSSENDLFDAEYRDMLAKKGENEFNESRSDKARRKAEEKRQARLEKELLEEEEKKQREEVARLVEERRRLRNEKTEAEIDQKRGSSVVIEKHSKKEAKNKRRERSKDKDKGSSKSNSDVEELEKKAGKESEQKMKLDNKIDLINGLKSVTASSYAGVNAGTRYFDRMKGSFLSSSKAFGRGNFFGKGVNSSAIHPKDKKSSGSVDNEIQSQASANRRESHQAELVVQKVNMDADDKHAGCRPVLSEHQPLTAAPMKSWQQLFTRSSVDPPSSNSNFVCTSSQKFETEGQSPRLSNQPLSTQSLEHPITFGLPSTFTISNFSNGHTVRSSCCSFVNDHMLPHVGEMHQESLQEEPELFEDPGFVPDPMSLLEKSPILKNVIAPSEVNRPSPIESPLSRLKISHDIRTSALDDSKSTNEKGTWQMWNSHPLVQDGLGMVSGQATWLLPPKKTGSTKEDFVYPPSDNNMASFFTNDLVFDSPSKSATIHPSGLPPSTCVSKKEWAVHGSGEESVAHSSVLKPHIRGLYYTPHVQSLWAYD